jgi:hypothetical protein
MNEQRLADLVFMVDRRWRRFPAAAACSCGESNPLLLVSGRKPACCLNCDLRRRGLDPVEEHHLGGRPSEQTILVPANPHALLSFLQRVWRGAYQPSSSEAYLFDLVMLRALGPSIGIELP